jgi:hypothetical protein
MLPSLFLLFIAPPLALGFTPLLPPLLIYYSASHADNAVVATAEGAASLDASYKLMHAGALLSSNTSTCAGGAVPLVLYANSATNHHFTSGSARGAAWAAANGFSPLGPQGCVFAAGDASMVALEQWVSATRGDHFLVGDEESRSDARSAGYTFEYIDSFAPAPWVVWPNEPHPDIPFPRSADLLDVEIEWARNAVPPNIGADTWYVRREQHPRANNHARRTRPPKPPSKQTGTPRGRRTATCTLRLPTARWRVSTATVTAATPQQLGTCLLRYTATRGGALTPST